MPTSLNAQLLSPYPLRKIAMKYASRILMITNTAYRYYQKRHANSSRDQPITLKPEGIGGILGMPAIDRGETQSVVGSMSAVIPSGPPSQSACLPHRTSLQRHEVSKQIMLKGNILQLPSCGLLLYSSYSLKISEAVLCSANLQAILALLSFNV